MKDRIARLIENFLGNKLTSLEITKLHGDASNRIYYRAAVGRGVSYVVMQLPPGNSSVSEEITNLPTPAGLPFVNIARFLKKRGVPVPEIYHYAPQDELLLLEDCGDTTLEKLLPQAPVQEKEKWYQQAIDLLVELQDCTTTNQSDCIALQRSFDETLFNWEFNHFLQYGMEARGIKLTEEDRRVFIQQTRFVTFALCRLPQVFTHRDFQSRNLMVQGGRLRLLDFQDALLGPAQYDLVALLRDSYVTLDSTTVEALVNYYLGRRPAVDRDLFKKMFHWITIQRKLKDAGRFVYMDRVKKNPSFLKFIPASLAYVQEALERQPELKPLLVVLKKYVPEFQP